MTENSKTNSIFILKLIYIAIMSGLFIFYFVADQTAKNAEIEQVLNLNDPLILISVALIAFSITFHRFFNQYVVAKAEDQEQKASKYFVLKIVTAAELEAAALLALITSMLYEDFNAYVVGIFVSVFVLLLLFFPKDLARKSGQVV